MIHCIENHYWKETVLTIKNLWNTLGVINAGVAVIRSCSLRCLSQHSGWLFSHDYPEWGKSYWYELSLNSLTWRQNYSPQAGLLMAMHRSGLKLSLRSWVLAQGLTSAQGKIARSRNQRGIPTLFATCQRENPVLRTSCWSCVHMKLRTKIQIYISKWFSWFFSSLVSFIMNPVEFQSSEVCLQSILFLPLLMVFHSPIYP